MNLLLGSWEYKYYLIALFVAFFAAIVATPVVKAIALRVGKVDLPSARKVHKQPIPRLGGIAICTGTIGAVVMASLLGGLDFLNPELIGLGLGSICFFSIGLVDDLFGLSPITRLILQSAVASAVWLTGIRIEFMPLPGIGAIQLGWLSLPITIIWLAGVVNAINWIDGLDGLASGVSGIAAITLFIICLSTGHPLPALFALALSGSLLGFLFYNFNPAQIFMGDGGSYFIGFLLASIGVVSLFQDVASTAIPIPFLVLAVPIVDMSAVIIARVSTGSSPFTAECRHLHHRLLKAGLSHRFTVLVIYTLALWSGSLATVLMGITNSYVFLASASSLLGFMTWKILSSLRQTEPELEFSVR